MTKGTDIPTLAAELRATFSVLKRRLRERATLGDLPPSQTDVLRQLDRGGPTTVSRLAREAGVRPQSMSATVAALETMGWVSGSPDPNDGRQTLIALTPVFRERLAKGRAAREDWLAEQIGRLSEEDQAHLAAAAAILRRISEH